MAFWNAITKFQFAHTLAMTETTRFQPQPRRGCESDQPVHQAAVRHRLWPPGIRRATLDPALEHFTPAGFTQRLDSAMTEATAEGSPYIVIYGHGSAWDSTSTAMFPQGELIDGVPVGPVDPNWQSYVNALRQAEGN